MVTTAMHSKLYHILLEFCYLWVPKGNIYPMNFADGFDTFTDSFCIWHYHGSSDLFFFLVLLEG